MEKEKGESRANASNRKTKGQTRGGGLGTVPRTEDHIAKEPPGQKQKGGCSSSKKVRLEKGICGPPRWD